MTSPVPRVSIPRCRVGFDTGSCGNFVSEAFWLEHHEALKVGTRQRSILVCGLSGGAVKSTRDICLRVEIVAQDVILATVESRFCVVPGILWDVIVGMPNVSHVAPGLLVPLD